MAKLETEITISVRDLPEVQQVLTECRELRDAAQEYMRACPADPDTTAAFYAAHVRLLAAIAALSADGVSVVHGEVKHAAGTDGGGETTNGSVGGS